MKERAVLYARVSDDDRPNDGRNLAGQLEMCREYALANDWEIVAELSEDVRGASGYKLQLPQLENLLAMAENRDFDILVVREMDRLSRRLVKQILVEDSLTHCGVRLEYVLGDYPDTPDGNLLKNIRAVVSEYEREKILERFRRGTRLSIKSGNVAVGANPPYGYEVAIVHGKRNLVIVEKEAKIVRQIFNWYAYGDNDGKQLSTSQIVRKLNDLDVPTPSQSKGYQPEKHRVCHHWKSASINNILRKETYIGTWGWGKCHQTGDGRYIKTDPSTHLTVEVPAIVDRGLWADVKRRKAIIKSKIIANTKKYLLYRRLSCAGCGARISTNTVTSRMGKVRRYYSCYRAAKNDRSCHNSKFFPAKWLDESVFNGIKKLICFHIEEEKRSKDQILDKGPRQKAHLINTEKVRVNQDRRMLNSFNLYLSGELTIDNIVRQQQKMDDYLAELEKINAEYLTEISEATNNSSSIINSILPQDFMEQLLRYEDVEPDKRRIIIESTNTSGILSFKDGLLIAKINCTLGNISISRKYRGNSLHLIKKN